MEHLTTNSLPSSRVTFPLTTAVNLATTEELLKNMVEGSGSLGVRSTYRVSFFHMFLNELLGYIQRTTKPNYPECLTRGSCDDTENERVRFIYILALKTWIAP